MLSFNGSAKCPIIAICMWRNNVIYSPGSHKNVNRGTQSKISGLNTSCAGAINDEYAEYQTYASYNPSSWRQLLCHGFKIACLRLDKVLTSGNELVKTGALSDNWNPGENCNSDNQMFHLFAFDGEFITTSPNFRWKDCRLFKSCFQKCLKYI